MTTNLPGGGVSFKVWAPKRKTVQVAMDGRFFPLTPVEDGYFSGTVPEAKTGSLYKFKLDEEDYLYPDPQSRFQPAGPHGQSQVLDPNKFKWTDEGWKGIDAQGQIVYEMHVGTFTNEGTWKAARAELSGLAKLGITTIELMPVVEYAGRWGWGYDGVDIFAPSHLYGTPDELKAFINEAHRRKLAVILDVVYNHFGPDGNYAKSFADDYFTDKYQNDWGESINFESKPVRDFYLANAVYWIEEFHFDGLRLDATQDIKDASPVHILADITDKVHEVASGRKVYVVAENEPQDSWIVQSTKNGGYGIDALWNDDLHHSALVALTGRREAYYTDYKGSPQEFISAAKYGYLYQGQRYKWQEKRRGSPALHLNPWNFVGYLQNHDQVANSARGQRPNTIATPAAYRAFSALLMLGPWTPMLFQGQEFGATTPFLFFCDHAEDLGKQVYAGRRKFLAQFRSLAQPAMQEDLPDPGNPTAFERSKLDSQERTKTGPLPRLYKDLIKLRRTDKVFREPKPRGVDGAVLSEAAFVLRYFSAPHGDRLLLINFGADLHLDPSPEPLLAPPMNRRWSVLWSSEKPEYGGTGTFPPDSEDNWRIAGNSALVLSPSQMEEEDLDPAK